MFRFLVAAAISFASSMTALAAPLIWFSSGDSLYQVDGTSNALVRTIAVKSIGHLAADGQGAVWAATQDQIVKIGADGAMLFQSDLKTLGLASLAIIAVDLYDNSVWLTDSKSLVRLDAQGQKLATLASPLGGVRQMRIGLDESVWLLGTKQLARVGSSGAPLAVFDLRPVTSAEPKDFVVDDLGGLIWLAGEKELVQVDRATASHVSNRINLADVAGALALQSRSGAVWVLGSSTLASYAMSGALVRTVDLANLGVGGADSLAFDSAGESLWVTYQAGLARVSTSGALVAVVSTQKAGEEVTASGFIVQPTLALLQPQNGSLINNPTPTFMLQYDALCNGVSCGFGGSYFSGYSLSAVLNGQNVGSLFATNAANGQATFTPSPRLPEGLNTFTAQVQDMFGHSSNTVSATFTVDTVAPEILSLTPASPFLTNHSPVHITGRLSEAGTVRIGGNNVAVGADFSFSYDQAVVEGLNTVIVQAIDLAGNSASRSLAITLDTTVPPIPNLGLITIGSATPGTTSPVSITGSAGSVEANARVVITNTRTGTVVEVVANAQGAFSAQIAAAGGDAISIVAFDAAGNASTPATSPVPNAGPPLPPDPATVATPITPATSTTLGATTAFLYTGANPIQTGVAPGTIDLRRAAVLRGRVLAAGSTPLGGVKITVAGHPELGQTLSRADGRFDLAVNGGGGATVQYEKAGYLSAQRQANLPWQDFAYVSDVVMTALDTRVTMVNLAANTAQVAQGSTMTDADGTRKATVLFPAGVTASMTLPNGTTQSLTTISVRATEYTVGPDGPKRMPAPLPPTSGYTYAVELTADEALAAGASEVTFNQPLPVYVDNFVHFPIGTIVPAGYYDRHKAAWIASKDGRVMKVLSVTGGMADLDVKGTGSAADATLLAKFGITDAERQQIATVFAAGASFWRVPTAHFTPWDHNLPYGPPSDAIPPTGCDDDGNCVKEEQDKECEPCSESGSVVEAENQVLGERIPIAGTPFSLNYRSDRVSGYQANHRIRIPLSNSSALPASLKRIDLTIQVAGREFVLPFPPASNQTHVFDWDGKDAYGRDVPGKVPVSVTIGYVYPPNYQAVASDDFNVVAQNFGKVWGTPFGFSARGEFVAYTQKLVYLRSKQRAAIAQGLGAWTLDVNHIYDPVAGGTLLLGDGSTREVQNVYMTSANASFNAGGIAVDPVGNIYTVQFGCCGLKKIGVDGSITTVSSVNSFVFEVLAQDQAGYLYSIAEFFNKRAIVKIAPDGSNTLIAGDLFGALNGSGVGLATKAVIRPKGLAVDKDGTIYFSEQVSVSGNQFVDGCYIKRLSTDGIISIVAGDGSCRSPSGDGGPASQAKLAFPSLMVLDDQGNLVFADGSFVRKITVAGTISRVAGGDTSNCNNPSPPSDNVPATTVCLGAVRGVTFDKEGSLLVAADNFYGRIRRETRIWKIRADGLTTAIAGGLGPVVCSQGGGVSVDLVGPAKAVCPGTDIFFALAVNANNDVVATLGTHVTIISGRQTKWVGLSGPTAAANEGRIPSSDGRLMYVLNAIGKHDRTVDTRTGATLYQFGYDVRGLLNTIQDGDANVTTIMRDADGNPLEIVGPYGQHTAFTLDPNGYLASVANPMGETHRMIYDGAGLLKSFQTPRGPTSTFAFDVDGRLQRDQNAAGGFWQLDRTTLPDSTFEVAVTSAMGRVSRHRTEIQLDDTRLRTSTSTDGTISTVRIGADGVSNTTYTNGAVATTTTGPDSRFGMQAPINTGYSFSLPSGLTFNKTRSRTNTLLSPGDPLSLSGLTETTTVNGRVFTTTYDAPTRQFTNTSPEGRATVTRIDSQGRPTFLQVGGIPGTSYVYDSHGRIASVVQAAGADARSLTMGYGSDGLVQTITDALTRQIIYQRDLVGRVSAVTLPGARTTGFGYDANGNMTSITPSGRPAHGFKYSPVDLVGEYDPPPASLPVSKTLFTYDLERKLSSVTRPDGLSLSIGYDSAGRLASLIPSAGGGDPVTYGYSASSGQLTTLTTPIVTLGYVYDGGLIKQETFAGAVNSTLDRTFDADLRVSSVAVNNSSVSFTYDRDSLVTHAGALAISRSPTSGFVTGSTLGSIATTTAYNTFGDLASFSASFSASALYGFTLGYDQLNRVTSKTETLGGGTVSNLYGYDLAGRLQTVTQNGQLVRTYDYDPNGNRIRVNGASVATYDDQDRMTRYGTANYVYGANGELSQKIDGPSTTRYVYDVFGNLRSVTLPDGTKIDYLVDGRNRRIGKKLNGSLVQAFVYEGQLRIAAELSGTGAVVSRFVYATKMNVPEYMVKSGATYRVITDHLGSVRLVVDVSSGAIAQRIDYDEWGNVTADSNPGFQPFGFAGGLFDRDTGLVRFGVRDYDPVTGRWLAKDPGRFNGGDTNLYAYSAGNPVSAADPLGLKMWWNGHDSWTDVPDGPDWVPYTPGNNKPDDTSGTEPTRTPSSGYCPPWDGHVELITEVPKDNLVYPAGYEPKMRPLDNACYLACLGAGIAATALGAASTDVVIETAEKGAAAAGKAIGKAAASFAPWVRALALLHDLGELADVKRVCNAACH